jgi:hypothetical protein
MGVEKFKAEGLTEQTMKLVDTGLWVTALLFAIAIISIILGPVIRLVYKK